MANLLRYGLACGVSILGVTSALAQESTLKTASTPPAPVSAASAATPHPSDASPVARDELETVVVTARKRAENVQTVPIAITAVTSSQLADRGVVTIKDLTGNIPSFSTAATGGPNSAFPNFGIRGQRSDSYFILQSPTVITYFAGAPQGHPVGFGDNLYDIASVQVLKGPQGTLFGVNATGGALLVEPNRPGDSFHASFNASYGNYNEVVAGFMVNAPLADAVSLRVAGQIHRNDGYMKNLTTGAGLDKAKSVSLRPSLLLKPFDGVTSLTTIDYYRDKGAPAGNVLIYVNPAKAILLGGAPAAQAEALAAYQRAAARTGSDRWNIESSAGTGSAGDLLHRPQSQDILNFGATNDTSVSLGDNLTLRNIFSYRHVDADVDVIFGSVPSQLVSLADYRQVSRQISEELQLTGKALDNRLDFVVGGYLRREKGFDDATSGLVPAIRLQNSGGGTIKNYSGFGQVSFKFTDNLTLTGGLRYNHDVIYGYSDSKVLSATSPLIPKSARTPLVCNVGTLSSTGTLVRFPLTACLLDGQKTFNKATWLGSLEYKVPEGVLPGARNTLIYFTSRSGYRAGGFNERSTAYPLFGPFQPETITDFEAGLKSDWSIGGMHLRTNVAAFYDKLKNLQRSVNIPVPGSPQPLSTVTNAAKSTVYGLEFEYTLLVTPEFQLSGFYDYLHNKYDSYTSFTTTGAPIDLSGRPFRASPRNQFAVTARYSIPMRHPNEEIALAANYIWQDDSKLSEVPDARGIVYSQPAYGLLNGHIDWNSIGGSKVSAGLYIRNALNKFYATGYADLSTSAGVSVITPGDPRTYGVSLRVAF